MALFPPLFGFFLPGCAEQTGSSHSAALFLPLAKTCANPQKEPQLAKKWAYNKFQKPNSNSFLDVQRHA